MPRYRLYLREASTLERLDELTDWLAFRAILRFNRAGSWTLRISRESPSAALITPTSGIVMTRDNATIFSGFVRTYKVTAREIQVDGLDDMARLQVPILPDPGGPPYPSEHYVQTGQVSSVLRQLVHLNVGPGARIDRRVFGLSNETTDPLLGSTITVRAAFDDLLATMEHLAADDGLRFVLLQTDTPTTTGIRFSVMEPADRSDYAQFSVELGTASDFEDITEAPPANYFYVRGGNALGASRTIVEGGNVAAIASVGRQIEAIIEKRGVTATPELTQTLNEAIAGAAPARKVTVTPVDVQALEFGPDPNRGWDMGDIVQFIVNGLAYLQVVREVEITLDPTGGARAIPLIGDAGATNDGATLIGRTNLQTKALGQRIGALESHFNLPNAGVGASKLAAGAAAGNLGSGSIIAAMLAAGAAISNIGFTPARIHSGGYTGDGATTRTISTPFTPQFVVVVRAGSGVGIYLQDGSRISFSYSTGLATETTGGFVTNGFTVHNPGNNVSGAAYGYIAVG